jgi:hypothetical protein
VAAVTGCRVTDHESQVTVASDQARRPGVRRKTGASSGWRGHPIRTAKPVTIGGMAKYVVNESAVDKAHRLIRGRQYVLNSNWGDVQPNAEAENAFLASHSWLEYGEWHLGLTEGVADERKARYAFVYGDFRRLHRTGLIACHYRAAEWRHKEIELAAHDLLQLLDRSSS